MINKKHKFTFIHVAKTGGNTFHRTLLYYSDYPVRVGSWNHNKGGVKYLLYPKHQSIEDRYNFLLEEGEDPLEYTFVVVVRNPWDHVLSKYLFANKNKFKPSGWNAHLNKIRGNDVRQIIDNSCNVKLHILRFENFENDLQDFINTFELTKINSIGHHNISIRTSEKIHYSAFYDDKHKEIVANNFSDLIEKFEYSFERKSECKYSFDSKDNSDSANNDLMLRIQNKWERAKARAEARVKLIAKAIMS